MKVLTKKQIRELENAAVRNGLKHLQLMQRAGEAAFLYLMSCGIGYGRNITLLCGSGNNGGDGFVVARKFSELEKHGKIRVVLTEGEPSTPDARVMYENLDRQKIELLSWPEERTRTLDALEDSGLVIDCVYGVGFHGSLPGAVQELFAQINSAKIKRIAIDTPSGICCDTGEVSENAFQAHLTLTFSSYKPLHWMKGSQPMCGEVVVLSIGIPESLMEIQNCAFEIPVYGEIKELFHERPKDSHKGTYGSAVCICGSYGMAGAAVLSACGALRCGAGLVHLWLPKSIYPIAASRLLEPVMLPLEETDKGHISQKNIPEMLRRLPRERGAVLFGCGVGTEGETGRVLEELVKNIEVPMVLDADGLNLLSEHMNILETAKAPIILTPHPGEMARLLHSTIAEVQSRREEHAVALARQYGITVVLKGFHTIVAFPDGKWVMNPTGNAGMAKGGSGDLLAGMLVSFLAQGMPVRDAAVAAVYLHGMAGDRCAQRISETSMLSGDMAQELGRLFREIEQRS